MGKKIKLFILLMLIFSSLNVIASPLTVLATTPVPVTTGDECSGSISSGVKCFGNVAYNQDEPGDITIIIAGIINILLALLGLIFLVLIIYGGYTWMTAMGETEKIKKAKQVITSAAIGLIIIILSYAIVNFAIYLINRNDVFEGGSGYTGYGS